MSETTLPPSACPVARYTIVVQSMSAITPRANDTSLSSSTQCFTYIQLDRADSGDERQNDIGRRRRLASIRRVLLNLTDELLSYGRQTSGEGRAMNRHSHHTRGETAPLLPMSREMSENLNNQFFDHLPIGPPSSVSLLLGRHSDGGWRRTQQVTA